MPGRYDWCDHGGQAKRPGDRRAAHVIHPGPVVAEAIRPCGDADNHNCLTPVVKRIFDKRMALERSPETWTGLPFLPGCLSYHLI